jgi:flagellar motor switch protein FliG
MSGLRKAAIVALMIGEDASASIFKHLSEDEIETLLSEMAALGRVSSKMGEQVLEEFHQTAWPPSTSPAATSSSPSACWSRASGPTRRAG